MLDGFKEINEINIRYYFGIKETELINTINSYSIFLKVPLLILSKFTTWILSLSGIRDSASNANEFTMITAPIWMVILRISNGIFFYLPTFYLSLIYLFKTVIKKFNGISIPTLYICINSLSVLVPSFFLFSNERYFFSVFPALLIPSAKLFFKKENDYSL